MKKLFPSKKYLFVSVINFAAVYVIYIALFDVLSQPAWFWVPVITVITMFVRYNVEKLWVFRGK
jgi:hypothetical protein